MFMNDLNSDAPVVQNSAAPLKHDVEGRFSRHGKPLQINHKKIAFIENTIIALYIAFLLSTDFILFSGSGNIEVFHFSHSGNFLYFIRLFSFFFGSYIFAAQQNGYKMLSSLFYYICLGICFISAIFYAAAAFFYRQYNNSSTYGFGYRLCHNMLRHILLRQPFCTFFIYAGFRCIVFACIFGLYQSNQYAGIFGNI